MPGKMVVRGLVGLFVGLLAGFVAPTPASAHAYLVRSAPADGAILDRSPDLLTLSFTEHVELSATHIDIVDADGRHWAPTSIAVKPHGDTGVDTETPVDVVAGLPTLPANVYHVAWQTLSSDDLHVTSGTLVLGVQRAVGAAGAPPGPGGPGVREAILRGAGLIGLCVLLGGAALALVLVLLTRGRTPSRAVRDRLLRVAGAGGVLALAAVPLQLVLQTSSGGGRLLLAQATSGRWLMRELGVALLLAGVVWCRRGAQGRPARVAVAMGAAGAALAATGTALLGHPAGGAAATGVIGAVHVLAAGGWAGSVLAAALALVPILRTERDQVRALLRSFAVLAAACLALLTVTGLLMTSVQVSTVDALLTTPYGLILVAKVAAAAVAALLGLRTFRRLRRPVPVPRRGLLSEAAVLVLAAALAGALAAAGPANGPRFPVGTTVTAEPEVSGQAADLIDTVQVRPNQPGRNVVSIVLADTRRPAPAPVSGVSVQLTGPDGTRRVHPVVRTADGWRVSVDDIRTTGQWQIAVTVMRPGLAPVTDGHSWTVPPTAAQRAGVVVSAQSLQPWSTWLAWTVAGGSPLLALALLYRRRRMLGRDGVDRPVAGVVESDSPANGETVASLVGSPPR
jgi:copper transport protein